MAIAFGLFVFTHDHGDVMPLEPPQLPITVAQFAGVKGESHIVDEPKGRDLVCRYTMDGFVSRAALDDAINLIHAEAGKQGTIEISGNLAREIPNCTFLGFVHQEAFIDGSGVNGFVVRGLLRWRQRRVE